MDEIENPKPFYEIGMELYQLYRELLESGLSPQEAIDAITGEA